MDSIEQEVILSTAYLPNIQYFSKLLLHNAVHIEIHDTFQKQSFRNRCTIYGANGKQDLTIPVTKPNGNRTITKDILIDYDSEWQQNHWRAIISAYGHSPFFEIFEPELAQLFKVKEKFLVDFNVKALQQVFDSIGINVDYKLSSEYIKEKDSLFDFRDSIHPKLRMQKPDIYFNQQDYFQVFAQKHGFIPNLSIIDLMFHEGPQAIDICKKSIQKP